MSTTEQKSKETGDREIVISRSYDAPRELVFAAWTEPDRIGRWWGPDGFTTTTYEMDFRPGGSWRFTMHGPDGTDYPNRIAYTSIKKNDSLKYDHYGHEDGENDPPHFKSTVTFEDRGGTTRVTLRMLFPTKEARDETVAFGAVEGGKQTLGRLAAYLDDR